VLGYSRNEVTIARSWADAAKLVANSSDAWIVVREGGGSPAPDKMQPKSLAM
jgi:hypothetical protein